MTRPPAPTQAALDARTRKRFRRNLRAARQEAELSQRRLAEKAQTTQKHIYSLEAGRVGPSLRMVGKLARALGISVAGLTGG